jgi:hypothetical protein
MTPTSALLLIIVCVAGLAYPASARPLQRMLLTAGCYDLRPGVMTDASAYCLDEERRAPPHGSLLTQAPAQLGDAIVRSGEQTVSLSAAIENGWLLIEGMGEFSTARLRNVSTVALTVCIRQLTVVMAADGSAGSLTAVYDPVKELASQYRGAADDGTRTAVQGKLWSLVHRAEQTSDPNSGDVDAPKTGQERPVSSPKPTRCSARDQGSTVACVER